MSDRSRAKQDDEDDAQAYHLKAEGEAVWAKENATAIAAYNQHVKEQGVFSDGLRVF